MLYIFLYIYVVDDIETWDRAFFLKTGIGAKVRGVIKANISKLNRSWARYWRDGLLHMIND